MDDKLKGHIQCLIENVGLNATRHKDQELVIEEAKEVMEVIVKNCYIPLVIECLESLKSYDVNYSEFEGGLDITEYQNLDGEYIDVDDLKNLLNKIKENTL